MRVCTAAQMRELDRVAIEEFGIPGVVLMEVAGRGVVDVIRAVASPLDGRKVAVACGRGNNGGDGYVVARHLLDAGAEVSVVLASDPSRVSGDALINLESYRRLGGSLHTVVDDSDVGAVRPLFEAADVIVDALLGTGLSDEVRGRYRTLIETIEGCAGLKIAVDIPSGLSADDGRVLGVAAPADHTVTFGFPKVGLVTDPGAQLAGELHVVDIGIPEAAAGGRAFAACLLDDRWITARLRARPPGGHKGTFGHVAIVAGSPGKSGAALLCAEAALRAGAGLATILAPQSVLPALETKTREVMLAPLLAPGCQQLSGSDEQLAHVRQLLEGKSVLAFGPGMPTEDGARAFVARLVREAGCPLVIDADGLNLIAGDSLLLRDAGSPVVVTPHPGEMARLCGRSPADVQADRLGVAQRFAADHAVTVVLKGARTVIATPDDAPLINPTGNSGMASGGMGDALTGIVGALVAQGYPAREAAAVGVYAHGRAGDVAAVELGEHAVIASDVIARFGRVVADLPSAAEHAGC